jgi:2-amino-4-hydroxy-6-hydroxymethyldihydropteridine diphosphokinase
MTRAYLALGSNLDDRAGHLQAALDALASAVEVAVVAVSDVYETEPVGPEQPDYLNAVVALDTHLDARGLLRLAQELEQAAARVRGERWGPRTLDVDVLLVGDEAVDDPDLQVPHPRMWERGFVLAPLRDVAPEIVGEPGRTWPGVQRSSVQLRVARRGGPEADRDAGPEVAAGERDRPRH